MATTEDADTDPDPLPPASQHRDTAVITNPPLFCQSRDAYRGYPSAPPRGRWPPERQLAGVPTDWRFVEVTAQAHDIFNQPYIAFHERPSQTHPARSAIIAVCEIAQRYKLDIGFVECMVEHIKGRCIAEVDCATGTTRTHPNGERMRYLLPRVPCVANQSRRFVLNAWYFVRKPCLHYISSGGMTQPHYILVRVECVKKIYTKRPKVTLVQLVQDYTTHNNVEEKVDTYVSEPFELNLLRHCGEKGAVCHCCGSREAHEKVFLGNNPRLRKNIELCARTRVERGQAVWE